MLTSDDIVYRTFQIESEGGIDRVILYISNTNAHTFYIS